MLLLADVLYKNMKNGLLFKDILCVRKACIETFVIQGMSLDSNYVIKIPFLSFIL